MSAPDQDTPLAESPEVSGTPKTANPANSAKTAKTANSAGTGGAAATPGVPAPRETSGGRPEDGDTEKPAGRAAGEGSGAASGEDPAGVREEAVRGEGVQGGREEGVREKGVRGEGVQGGREEDAREEGDAEEDDAVGSTVGGLTPRQARRLRVAAASVLLVALAAVLVVRLASRTSVLVVGVYGLAMILCGIVIELSRNGRTRLATWLLVGGLATALALDWLVLP
ncbi:hypothetical protein [Streptomyces sp. NPDC001744]|uniref:hypothetical protein n=1 Tax=Streptomyces sp. NPDC001744 TaxID=3364606 RepID=UPI00368F6FBF